MLFGKKNVKVTDAVWMSQAAKWRGIIEEWKKDNHLSIICWFEATYQQLEILFGPETGEPPSLFLASQMHPALLTGSNLLFAEHYPLPEKEMKLYDKLSLTAVTVYSALDEPLFQHFGGEKIIAMMKQMGMKETEGLQHQLISSSIRKAQDKIEKKVSTELLCHSQEDWFQKNMDDR